MIYIIDDDQQVKEGYMILLKSAGFICSSIDTPTEFLKNYKPDNNDLIILDFNMPNQNGCNFLEILFKNGIIIPVIIITAHDDKASRECAKKYGAIAYLSKPVDSGALIDILKFNLLSKIS